MLLAIHLIIIFWLIIKYRQLQVNELNVMFSLLFFLLKIISGVAVYYIYRDQLKQGDIFLFIRETDTLFSVLKHSPVEFLKDALGFKSSPLLANLENWNAVSYNPFFSDNRTFLFFNLLIRIVSFGNVYVNILYANLISYIGLICLYKSFRDKNFSSPVQRGKGKAIYYLKFIPFFLPTVMIFGSALSKESLLLCALGLFVKSLDGIQMSNKKMNVIYLLFSSLFLILIKTYLFLVLFPGMLALFFYKYNSRVSLSRIFVSAYCGGLLILLFIGKHYPEIDFPAYLFGQKLNMIRNAVFSGARTLFDPVLFAPEIWSFIKHTPQAIASAFFHPFPWQFKSFWMTLLSFDSIILFGVLIYVFIKRKQIRFNNLTLTFLFLFASLILLMMLGFTVPVLGNLVRFKMPAMLMLGLSLCFFRLNELPKNNTLSQ